MSRIIKIRNAGPSARFAARNRIPANQITASTTLDYLDGQLYQRVRRLARANTYAWWRNVDGTRAFVKAEISTHIKAKGPTATLDIDMAEILWEEPNN